MASVDVEQVSVVKGGTLILDRIDLAVADGELMGIVGASGSGKTTMLRVIAGLEDATGSVRIGGIPQEGERRRDVAMVFQDSVLFPNRDVEGNVAFPLEVRRVAPDEIRQRVLAEGRALHIEDLMARNPRELSAGHQQLVQIARALVRAPAVFLMDEPLARLDAKLRIHMRSELKIMQRGYGVTTLYVTNDPVEAMSVADRIAVFDHGAIVQVAPPELLYHEPANLQVAKLLGELAVLDMDVEPASDGSWLTHAAFRIRAWAPALRAYAGRRVQIGTRPEYLEVADTPDARVRVRLVEHLGASHLVRGDLGKQSVALRMRQPWVRPGDVVGVRFSRYMVFDPQTGRRLLT
jgi:ABC-type sugar transport system ATPase subunit